MVTVYEPVMPPQDEKAKAEASRDTLNWYFWIAVIALFAVVGIVLLLLYIFQTPAGLADGMLDAHHPERGGAGGLEAPAPLKQLHLYITNNKLSDPPVETV